MARFTRHRQDHTIQNPFQGIVSVHYADTSRSESIQRQLFNQGIAVHRPAHPAVSHPLRITADSKALSEAVLSTPGFRSQ
jgi:histidinol-phosphate aminotransferase